MKIATQLSCTILAGILLVGSILFGSECILTYLREGVNEVVLYSGAIAVIDLWSMSQVAINKDK